MIIDQDNIKAVIAEILEKAKNTLLEHGKITPVAQIYCDDLSHVSTVKLHLSSEELRKATDNVIRKVVAQLNPEVVVIISEGTMSRYIENTPETRELYKFSSGSGPVQVPCIAIFAAAPDAYYSVLLEVVSADDGKGGKMPVAFGTMEERPEYCRFTRGLFTKKGTHASNT